MLIPDLSLTPGLAERLRACGDALRVSSFPPDVVIHHVDGSDLYDYEERRVEGVVAAHSTEPF